MAPRDASLLEERKLAPVYEDIQNERYKSALGTLDRYLKKSPNSSLAHILRSFVLLKSGRSHEEVLSTWKRGVAAAENAGGGDIGSRGLWWSGIIMRDLQRWDVLLELYERMWAKTPDNSVLGEQILLISAAAWDTPKMVASSRKMFNLLKTPTWARVAAWAEWADKSQPLLAPSSRPFSAPASNPASLKIAQILLSTTRKAVPSADVLWLHLQVLLAANDLGGALALVKAEGYPGGGVGRTHWRMEAVREIVGRYSDRDAGQGGEGEGEGGGEGEAMIREVVSGEVKDFGELLRTESDMQRNYANYRYLTFCALASASPADVQSVRDTFEQLHAAVGSRERAPALALLDLDAQLAAGTEGRMSAAEWTGAVESYWARWGAKGVVLPDLLSVVGQRSGEMLDLAKQWLAGETDTLEQYMRVKHATLLALRLDDTWSASQNEFSRLWKLYQAGLPFGVNLPDTDVQPADELGLAAVQVLLILARQADHAPGTPSAEQFLVQATICLRYMLTKSPACASAKFALIRLYRMIGLMVKPLESLKIAEIQLDTLLHVASERGSLDAQAGQVGRVLEDVLERAGETYTRSASSLSESIKTAVEHESYASIAPIRELAHTLSHSVARGISVIERSRIALAREASSSGDEPDVVGDVDLKQLDVIAARKKEDWVDVRNWELFPAHVGVQQGRDAETQGARMLGLSAGEEIGDAEVDGEWCAAWADVLARLAAVGGSKAVSGVEVKKAIPASATLAEAAALTILHAALDGLHGTDAADAPGIDSAISTLTSLPSTASRWSFIHHVSLLIEVRDLLAAALARSSSKNKALGSASSRSASTAKANGNKNKAVVVNGSGTNGASSRVDNGPGAGAGAGAKALKEVLDKVQSAVDGVKEEIGKLAEGGGDGWAALCAELGMDEHFVVQAIDEIRSARAATLENLQSLCTAPL